MAAFSIKPSCFTGVRAANIAGRVELEARFVVVPRSVLQTTPIVVVVPSASSPPGTPGHVILILAVGVSRLPVQAGAALNVVGGLGDDVLRHCRACQHRRKDGGDAWKYKLRHGILLFAKRKVEREPHAKLYAGRAQTQLKKYLLRLRAFAARARLGVDTACGWTRVASALVGEPGKICKHGLDEIAVMRIGRGQRCGV
jgi:hypothetical protein